jgi:hypothetical protein
LSLGGHAGIGSGYRRGFARVLDLPYNKCGPEVGRTPEQKPGLGTLDGIEPV